MKLTDQEQVILRAIDHVGRGGLAEIAKVVKAVGYPKATTKKILLRLSEKGAVSLHRHDWPASLKPEQRKLLVKIGRDYYSAVSVMKRNPSKQSKGKAAARRAGKALKGLARGALQSGAEILGAGAMALNPSQKRKRATKKKPNKTIIKAKRIDHLDVSKVHNPRKRRAKKNAARTVSAKSSKTRRARASSQTGRKKTAAKVRSVAKTRKASTRRTSSNPTRKGMRNAARLSASQWASEMARLRDIKPRPLAKLYGRQGPTAEQASIHAAQMREWNKLYRHASKMQKLALEEDNAAFRARQAQNRAKKKTRNPSAESIRKEFAGSINGERDLFFPQGTPSGKLAKLGKLVSITTEAGTIKPVSGTAWLCADTKGKLHIGSVSGAPLFDGPARSFGHVTKLEYESTKPHLGYKGPIIWFHRAGEENGIKPTLRADGKGGLVFRGGDYRLTRRGIEN